MMESSWLRDQHVREHLSPHQLALPLSYIIAIISFQVVEATYPNSKRACP